MMKRDSAGRVLVVNAAFLQMYGGTVQDWAGNPITGWPAPQAPGGATRFESRMPQADGTELVYDWLETSLSDGSALSIARDVTMFLQQQAPQSVAPTAPAEAPPSFTEQLPAQAAPPDEPAFQQTPSAQAHLQQAPVAQQAPAAVMPPAEQAPPTDFHSPPAAAEQTEPSELDISQLPLPPAQQIPSEPERDFERRALPIEDGGSVLGNNWRDAVIAKAVGVSDEAPQSEEPSLRKQKDAPSGGEPTNTNGRVRILLAEDNAINALLTRTLLEAEGCHVEVVEDGALAVEAIRNAAYDMIFMDMRMPNMDGLEATRKIRAMDHRSKGLPIVALTANAFDDDRNACFDSGMNDFMTKPVSAEELSEMVKVHTSKKEERLAS